MLRQERVLLCRRAARRRWQPGTWDLPGGHVEAGETPAGALVRELHEELGVRIAPPGAAPFHLSVPEFEMAVWVVRDWSGEAVNAAPAEHAEIAWFEADRVPAADLAVPAYRELIDRALAGP